MTLPTSGPISLGDINTERGSIRNSTVSLAQTEVRQLLQVSSGAISLSNAYGKSHVSEAFAIYDEYYQQQVGDGAGYSYMGYSSLELRFTANKKCFWNFEYFSSSTTTSPPNGDSSIQGIVTVNAFVNSEYVNVTVTATAEGESITLYLDIQVQAGNTGPGGGGEVGIPGGA